MRMEIPNVLKMLYLEKVNKEKSNNKFGYITFFLL